MMVSMRIHRPVVSVFVASLLASTPVYAQRPAPPPPAYDAPAAPAPLPWVPVPPVAPRPGGVYVELRASSPNVRIERLVGQLRAPVCYAPCRKVLPVNDVYIIGGDGVRSTSQFTLPEDRPQVTLDVKAGSTAQLAGGAGLILLGLIAGYVGYFVYLAGLVSELETGSHTGITAGIGIGVGGLALMGVGLVVVLSARTTVTTSTGATFTSAPARRRKRPALALTPRGLEF
jgi:hypothetical protein